VRLGALVLQTRPWDVLVDDFRRAEQLGYDIAYVADHLTHTAMSGEWLGDAWTTLAAAAVATSKIELGTLVASAAFRSPVTLARSAATVNDVAGGRLVLGLGAGSPACAAADRGIEPSQAAMSSRYADMVTGLAAVWAGESEWRGDGHAFAGVHTLSRPSGQAPPFLLLAAHGPRGFALVARHADGWSTYGGHGAVGIEPEAFWDVLAAQSAAVDAACREQDRDPAGVRRSLLLGYGTVRPTESPTAYRAAVERAEELGFDEVVVYWPEGEPGGRFWSDMHVHEAAVAALRR
jgi:alkanesulfonate monooxygenase SsuD/methylene tetrahydromethanopterin reductase-like flavin-dependent oxidoreductase (luciferase family)